MYYVVDERGANLTGIYDVLARVLNEQQILKAEREDDKIEKIDLKKKIETLQGKVDNSTAELEKTKMELEENTKVIDKLNTGNLS